MRKQHKEGRRTSGNDLFDLVIRLNEGSLPLLTFAATVLVSWRTQHGIESEVEIQVGSR